MKIKQIKWRPLISLMAVIFVVAQALMTPLNVFAKSTDDSTNTKMHKVGQTESGLVIQSSMNPTKNLKASGNSSGEMSATYGGYVTKTAYIEVAGEPAFCIEPSKSYPVNAEYAEAVYNDEAVMNILYYGYPNNGTSEKNYVDTYVALNYYLGNFDSPDMANDSGVKYLLNKAKTKTAPLGDFDISNKNQTATWNASTKRQETGWYETSYRSNGGTNYYSLPLPAGVSAVTSDGKTYTGTARIEAGKDFKLVADATFDKTISFDISTDLRKMSALKFTPNNSSVQKLLSAGTVRDPYTIQDITAKFTAQTGDGVIVKKDKDSGKTLSGAQYHVTGDDFDKTVTTGLDGKVNLNDLIVGNYKVVETKAPAGYTIDSTPKTLTIKAKETKAPVGYNIDTTVYPIKATQDNQTTEVFLKTATSKDKVIEGKVAITKTAGMPEDGNYFGGELPVLEGAEFTITSNTTKQVVDTITTDENGRAESNWLPYNTYTVHESITPAGYQPVPDFQVTIDTEGKTHYYVLEDVAKSSAIKVVKKDATTGKVIPAKGTQFRILDAMGNVIEQKVTYPTPMTISLFETASDGSFTMPYPLIAGDYFLQEVKAPTGYTLNAEPISFTVTGDVNEVTVECENAPQMGKIVLDKFGETVDNDKTTPNKLVYKETLLPHTEYDVIAKNDIKTADGTTRAKKGEVVDHVKTDAKGHAETKELFLGDYTLHETKAPTGYTLGADKEVSLKYAGQEVKVTSTSVDLHNKLVKSDIVITKKSSDGKKLAGVEFSLYDNHRKLIMTGTTDKNGQLTFKNVPYATAGYSVKETKGVDGYKMDTTAQKVSIEKDRESILLTFVNEKIPAKPLPKTGDTNTGTLVGGGILVLGGLTGLFATAYLNRKKKA
ncbi:SpaA isopeptide-forming pilin-related protein [Listeria monocytogenes]